MTVIGITGPSGAGKGVVTKILKNKFGYAVIDADAVYHELTSKPSDCLAEIRKHFGESVIAFDGKLDRAELRKYVFGEENREKLLLLNSVTHKHVAKEIKSLLKDLSDADVCIIDAPLLIEAGLGDICDLTVAVIADRDIRAQRIAERDSITHANAMLRISSQKDDEYYLTNTDLFIENNGDLNELSARIDQIFSKGGKRA